MILKEEIIYAVWETELRSPLLPTEYLNIHTCKPLCHVVTDEVMTSNCNIPYYLPNKPSYIFIHLEILRTRQVVLYA